MSAAPAEAPESTAHHAYTSHPHRTMWAMAVPMVGSLVAEPLTAVVDGLFIARLGATPTAALGIGVPLLSTLLFAFNFLGIGTQTRVAAELGAGRRAAAREPAEVAVALALLLGLALCLLGALAAPAASAWMGADAATLGDAVAYLRIRLLGAPAVLVQVAVFGALRGVQDMKTPLWVAAGTNLVNLALDPLLIFGVGPFPRLEVEGAAMASTIAQWLGAGLCLWMLTRELGARLRFSLRGATQLLVVGRDLFLRTALLLAFVTLAGRAATRIGADAGAAHHIVRSVWMLSAFLLDAFAIVAQSLVGYFLAAGEGAVARRVARTCLQWSVATGVVSALAMALATPLYVAALPEAARAMGLGAWWIAALSQPVASVSFATDGVHWGTGDYRFLRNAMLASTLLGACMLLALDASGSATLEGVWWTTLGWVGLRGAFGAARIWPGIGAAPLRASVQA